MSGTDTAAMVPDVYDVVIDGYGYVTARNVDPNLPFRTQQQALSYSPTFLERTNVSGNYGDDSQAFFLTASQNDWSGGEDQHFFRAGDPDSKHSYWLGSNIDITVPGQATLRPATTAVSLGGSVTTAVGLTLNSMFAASSTNLYEIGVTGAVTDRGAHGAGGLADAICTDGIYIYLTGVLCSKIRRYDPSAHTFADFSATPANAIAFLNNSLWGAGAVSGSLSYYDTSGAASSAYIWKGATGSATPIPTAIVPLGGKMVAMLPSTGTASGAEVWIADTAGAQRLAVLPPTLRETTLIEALGVLFVAGTEANAGYGCRTVVYYIANGSLNRLWASQSWNTSFQSAGVGLAKFKNGVIFNDVANNAIRYYDLGTGSTSVIASYTPSANTAFIASNDRAMILVQQSANTLFFTSTANVASSGYVASSLYDFDNSLAKLFRGVKVDFSAAVDGNGGSVDIAYQVDSLTGSWTTLQAGAVSGTEYALSGVSGHSIAIRITLNKGTSTLGPTLKRTYVRGVGVLQSYRVNEYILDLGGDTGQQQPVRRRDTSDHSLNGEEMRANLAAAITSQTPVTVIDRTGTFTAVLEAANCEFDLTRPGQWYAQIHVREI